MARDIPGSAGNYLSVGDVAAIDITGTALTVVCWLRPDTIGAEDEIISKRDSGSTDFQYSLHIASGGAIGFRIGDGGGTFDTAAGGTAVTTGVWHHLAGVKNGTGVNALKGYCDGVEQASVTSNVAIGDSAQALVFGRISNSDTNITDGLLAEIAIWNVALSPGELAALAKGVSPLLIRPQSLKGYWPLLGTGSPERDYSGQGNAATIVGSVAAGNHPPVMPFVFPTQTPPAAPGLPITTDSATILVDIQVSAVEVVESVDSATVLVDLQLSALEEFARNDAATVYIDLQNTGGECFSTFSGSYLGEGEAWTEFYSSVQVLEWSGVDNLEWSFGEVVVEGATC